MTYKISTVGVKLASVVGSLDVQHGLVDEGENLQVRGGTQELDTLDGALGDQASTVAWLGAPGDLLSFSIGDRLIGLGRSPNTPILLYVSEKTLRDERGGGGRTVNVVHECCLAKRVLVLSGRVTEVVTQLGATEQVVLIGFVGLKNCFPQYLRALKLVESTYNTGRVREMLVSKGGGRELLGDVGHLRGCDGSGGSQEGRKSDDGHGPGKRRITRSVCGGGRRITRRAEWH